MWNTLLLQTPQKIKWKHNMKIIDCLGNVNENVKPLLPSSGYAYHASYILKGRHADTHRVKS